MKALRFFNVLMAVLLAFSGLFMAAPPRAVQANSTAQTLPFSQNWSGTAGLITTADDWSLVPGIVGYRGDNLTSVNDVDPQTVLAADDPGVPDVNINQTSPNTYATGGVTEFEIADPVIAMQGSSTADAPYLKIFLNTSGKENIVVAYNVRDIDGSTDNAVQQVALHYRIGNAGTWTNIPAAYIADATTGPSVATQVTSVSVTLPAAANDQSEVQLRVMTTNATGNDEWVGIDDISITGDNIPDPAPTVASTSPTDGASGVAIDTDITITFSEAVTAAPGWYNISCTTSGSPAVTESGGPTIFTLSPDSPLANGETCTVTIYAANITEQSGGGQTMAADYIFDFTTTNCGATYTPIHDIQGSALAAALTGVQTTEAVVTVDYQAGGQKGFYMQSLTDDGNEATSEGIFVYNDTYTVNVGDHVRLTGSVADYTGSGFSNMTQFTNLTSLEVCATGISTAPTPVTLPDDADPTTYLERFEGMLVSFDQTLTVQQNYFQGRYGQLTLGLGRIFQINNVTKGGFPEPQRYMIILDDTLTSQNPAPIPYLPYDGAVRAGNTVTNLVGVLDNGAINTSGSATTWPLAYYRLQPTSTPVFDNTPNARTVTPPDVGGRLKIASFNVLNYFTTLNPADNSYPNPPYNSSNEPRGANTLIEFFRQQYKIVAALYAMDADVIGLMEIESWDDAQAAASLVDALNDYLLAHGRTDTYAFVEDPVLGYFNIATEPEGDYIQTAIIYKTQTVVPVGASLSVDDDLFDRSPFAQEFEEIATGEQFVVVVNHFKSKGSCPAEFLDPPTNSIPNPDYDAGDGQGCWNAKRVEQAEALLDFIDASLVPLDPDVFVIGDLNSYGAEDPIQALIDGGLENQVAAFVPEGERYSYVFDGTAGYLDHALGTPSTTAQITDVTFWHINADEPSVIDYNTEFKTVDFYEPHVFRASDHDPVLLGLNLQVPPIGMVDSYTTPEDTELVVPAPGVLANDMDLDGDALTAELEDTTTNGTLTFNPDGSFTYDPDVDFYGTDSFTYYAYDGQEYSELITVTIEVVAENDWPVAMDDSYITGEDVPLMVDAAEGVLANDIDNDPDDNQFVSLVTGPANGSLKLYDDGSFEYTPNENFAGTDTFEYMLISFPGAKAEYTDVGLVTIEVYEINDWPMAEDDHYSMSENGGLSVPAVEGVLANDTDPDPDNVGYAALVSGTAHGFIDLRQDGSFWYIPEEGFTGTDSFEYMFVSTYASKDAYTDIAVVYITVYGTAVGKLSDQTAVAGFDFNFVVPDGSFDPLAGETVLSARLADGTPLPAWLKFDPASATFSGKPENANIGTLEVKVYATNETGSYVSNKFFLPIIQKIFLPNVIR